MFVFLLICALNWHSSRIDARLAELKNSRQPLQVCDGTLCAQSLLMSSPGADVRPVDQTVCITGDWLNFGWTPEPSLGTVRAI